MIVLNREGMVAAEKAAIKSYITEESLMENAGTAAANFILKQDGLKDKKVTVVCGKGNNGGDGFVIARVLSKKGFVVSVVLGVELKSYKSIPLKMYKRLPSKVKIFRTEKGLTKALKQIENSDIIVDALFGTGFKGKADGNDKMLIDSINEAGAFVVSVDLPSGLEGNSGIVLGSAVKADSTITFEALKPCHILPTASSFCGEVTVEKIGIKQETLNEITPVCRVIEKPFLQKRDKNSHKGTFGTVLSVSGSYGMPGASILAAKAALRSGVGKLYAVCPPENYTALAVSVPEAVLILADIEKDLAPVFENLDAASSVLVGPGLGITQKRKDFVKELLSKAKVPVVVDADGINAIASDIEFIKKVKADIVFTPHAKEMSRLTGLSVLEIEQNRLNIAKAFAMEYGVYLCLKGANTLVATPTGELFVNMTGNPGLATSGSGDLLSGIMASFIAEGQTTLSAVLAAVYLHGEAGDRAAKTISERGMMASDIVENLPYLL